jgi:hypothetical protein
MQHQGVFIHYGGVDLHHSGVSIYIYLYISTTRGVYIHHRGVYINHRAHIQHRGVNIQ